MATEEGALELGRQNYVLRQKLHRVLIDFSDMIDLVGEMLDSEAFNGIDTDEWGARREDAMVALTLYRKGSPEVHTG